MTDNFENPVREDGIFIAPVDGVCYNRETRKGRGEVHACFGNGGILLFRCRSDSGADARDRLVCPCRGGAGCDGGGRSAVWQTPVLGPARCVDRLFCRGRTAVFYRLSADRPAACAGSVRTGSVFYRRGLRLWNREHIRGKGNGADRWLPVPKSRAVRRRVTAVAPAGKCGHRNGPVERRLPHQ